MGPVDETRLERFASSFIERPDLGVLAVYLFGSQAAGRAHRESDVDLALLLDRGLYPTAADRFDIRLHLMADAMIALGTNEVDLVILNDLPPLFARSILYEGRKLFVADAEEERDFACQVQLLAADLAPWLARMRKLKLAALAR